MSQTRREQVPAATPATRNDLFMQERVSARQAKRVARAAERQEKSDALKDEGNAFFSAGKYQNAVDRYQQAINIHGPSVKPVLLTNLAAAYIKLAMYPEALDAADRALTADPKSVKARYRRGMARKHMEMWTAAEIDFRTVVTLDPRNKDAKSELAFVEEKRCNPLFWEEVEEDTYSYSDWEAPALDCDPEVGESLSESSDCEHTGNGIPCKFYNRSECKKGCACRYLHAPDQKSERDALGRNVCRYYLMGACKFGERCSYLHSKECLLQQGWWSTPEGIDKQRRLYKLLQFCNEATTDFDNKTKASETMQKSKPKRNKKRSNRSRSGLGVSGSSRGIGTNSRKQYTTYSYSGYGSDGDHENGMCGFTGSEAEELLCQGVNPWDDDAWDVLNALHSYY